MLRQYVDDILANCPRELGDHVAAHLTHGLSSLDRLDGHLYNKRATI